MVNYELSIWKKGSRKTNSYREGTFKIKEAPQLPRIGDSVILNLFSEGVVEKSKPYVVFKVVHIFNLDKNREYLSKGIESLVMAQEE